MDYVKPADVATAMVVPGATNSHCRRSICVIRGGLAGGILAAATSLAITGAVQTSQSLVGALIFPVGLILIVLLGLDLVTGASAWCRCRGSSTTPAPRPCWPIGAGYSSAI